jgi:hypothetical protein
MYNFLAGKTRPNDVQSGGHHSRILGLEEESVVLSFRDVETLAGATVGRITVMRIIMMVVQDQV